MQVYVVIQSKGFSPVTSTIFYVISTRVELEFKLNWAFIAQR